MYLLASKIKLAFREYVADLSTDADADADTGNCDGGGENDDPPEPPGVGM